MKRSVLMTLLVLSLAVLLAGAAREVRADCEIECCCGWFSCSSHCQIAECQGQDICKCECSCSMCSCRCAPPIEQ